MVWGLEFRASEFMVQGLWVQDLELWLRGLRHTFRTALLHNVTTVTTITMDVQCVVAAVKESHCRCSPG